MYRNIVTAISLCWIFSATAQYKNDNVLYKTVDPGDLCGALEKNMGYILLDVRSAGEHNDSSASLGYNLGHLKGAINIDIRELGKRLSEIRTYASMPVFVYCSHSQRSRRAGKLLADSGFTNVYNINGGMTALYYTNDAKKSCLKSLLVTKNPYTIISATELCEKLAKDNGPYILDVRSDSAFRHISLNPKENAYGFIKGSINIPLGDLLSKLEAIPREKEVVITDIYGEGAASAALILKKNGYKNVSVLIEGIDRVLYSDEQLLNCKKSIYVSPVSYQLINVTEFGRFAKSNSDYLLLDIRPADEFGNKHKDGWRNIGHLKNAVNIPVNDLDQRKAELSGFKKKEVVVYSFGSSPEVFDAANYLQLNGFTKVKVMIGGLFNLRWTAANTKGNSYLATMVTDVPEENR